jgi:hypothetical protein
MNRPDFLLGVGAQKAATTWLYAYLRDHPQTAMGTIKELAVLHTALRPDAFKQGTINKIRRLQRFLDKQIQQMEPGHPISNAQELIDHIDNLAMDLDLERYWDYFDRIASAEPQARLIGDITPQYSGLEAEHYRFVATSIRSRGYRPRVVFLMRDPVERCYLMLKMGDRNSLRQGGKVSRPAHERFADDATQPWCEIYTRYENTIRGLESAFAPNELFYGFYESFMSEPEIRRLCAFLGLDYVDPKFGRRVNVSASDHRPSEAAIAEVRDFYDETYRFCENKFGKDFIRAIWQNA